MYNYLAEFVIDGGMESFPMRAESAEEAVLNLEHFTGHTPDRLYKEVNITRYGSTRTRWTYEETTQVG